MPRRGKGRLPHHDLCVAQHVLVPGRVEDYAAGVGVNAMDMQDAKLPLLLCPLQHLHKTNPSRNVSKCVVSASTVLLKCHFGEVFQRVSFFPILSPQEVMSPSASTSRPMATAYGTCLGQHFS